MKTLSNSTTSAGLAALLCLTFAAGSVAYADGSKDKKKDFDEETENRSEFWERALQPNKQLYTNRLKRAQRFLNRSDKQSRTNAERLLRDAIKLQPNAPLAYWYMGILHFRNKEWKKCATEHAVMFKKYPEFKPPGKDARNPKSLDMSLGTCNALAGRYEKAIVHFKRILSRADGKNYQVHWRLGETYMALGRLKDAIASLQTALRLYSSGLVRFALAAAYDRNEQLALAREHLKRASIGYRNLQIIPAADKVYYKALKAQQQGKKQKALLYFREYLVQAKSSQWRHRAQHHLKNIKVGKITTSQFTVQGSAKLDLKLLAMNINKAQPKFQRCLAKTPGLLLNVRLVSKKVPGKAKPVILKKYYRRRYGHYRYRSRRRGYYRKPISYRTFPPGATVTIEYQFKTTPDAAREAVQCAQTVATNLKIPKVTGSPGAWRKIVFSLIKLP